MTQYKINRLLCYGEEYYVINKDGFEAIIDTLKHIQDKQQEQIKDIAQLRKTMLKLHNMAQSADALNLTERTDNEVL